jgi:hypothetical protein
MSRLGSGIGVERVFNTDHKETHWGKRKLKRDKNELWNGRKLVTLEDAATYITEPPKKESALPEWQTAHAP